MGFITEIGRFLKVMLVSMLPIVEVKGAIPMGMLWDERLGGVCRGDNRFVDTRAVYNVAAQARAALAKEPAVQALPRIRRLV